MTGGNRRHIRYQGTKRKRPTTPQPEQAKPTITDEPVESDATEEYELPLRSSASKRKLGYFETEGEPIASTSQTAQRRRCSNAALLEGSLAIIDINSLRKLLDRTVTCKVCHSPVIAKYGLSKGFATQLVIECEICEISNDSYMSERMTTKSTHDVNKKAVLAAKSVGLQLTKLNRFFGLMDVSAHLQHASYYKITKKLSLSMSITSRLGLLDAHTAIRNEHFRLFGGEEELQDMDISVSYDGTWMKRGHQSLYGCGFVIDYVTGLCIDYDILSKYCHKCAVVLPTVDDENKDAWKEQHQPECNKNWDGSSGSMEAAMAETLWKRSQQKYDLRYTVIVSDGDTKTYQNLLASNVYGPDHPITKEECINHVGKRMYTGLQNAAKGATTKGHSIRGRGKLTDVVMKRWQTYYVNAIKKNAPNIEAMQHAIWAILYHSTNKHHNYCSDEWCYKIAKREGRPVEEMRIHHEILTKPLPQDLIPILKPLFTRLSETNLLKRCTMLSTQNANESLHSTLWDVMSKRTFCGLEALRSAVELTVHKWNQGTASFLPFAEGFGLAIGTQMTRTVNDTDVLRVKKAERHSSKIQRQRRRTKATQNVQRQADLVKKEGGEQYNPGAF